MTYESNIKKSSSEKIVLAHIEPAKRVLIWDQPSLNVYKIEVAHYVLSIEQDKLPLTEVSSLGALVSPGQYFFNSITKEVYLKTYSDENPQDVFIVLFFRLFLSNAPIILPYDLSSGRKVEYEPLILNTSNFGSYLENDDQIGVALEGTASISLMNNGGEFEEIFDKYFWENKNVTIYSYFRGDPLTEKQKLYEGFIEEKSYKPDQITFKLRDFISKLKDALPLSRFDGTEGDFPENRIGEIKRRIYGRVSGLKLFPLDNTLDGYPLTGLLSGTTGNVTINGSGTDFLTELSPDDEIFFIDDLGEQVKFKIETISNDNLINITQSITTTFINKAFTVNPAIPYRRKNRSWFIADHAIHETTTTVTASPQLNRIEVVDVTGFNALDFITIGSEKRQIKRVSGSTLVLKGNLSSLPIAGTTVYKDAVQEVYFEKQKLVVDRDYTVTNLTAGTTLELEEDAEKNITRDQLVTGTVSFSNGSRTLSGTGTLFKTEFKPRDFIKADLTADYYEILQIQSDTVMYLREVFATASVNTTAKRKSVTYIGDESNILINCFGKTKDGVKTGELIKTASDVVENLLIDAGLSSILDSDSFDIASEDAPYLISLALPLQQGNDLPTIRETIDLMNKTVFGSLFKNKNFQIEYRVLSPDKRPDDRALVKDDEILNWEVGVNSKNLVKTVQVRYRHKDVDESTLTEESFTQIERDSEISDKLIKTEKIYSQDLYLYDQTSAQVMLQRLVFFKEISQSILKIRTKLNFSNRNIGDVLYFNLDRLYTRFGTLTDKNKIGIISGVTTDGIFAELEIDDLSGFFLSVANITENTASDFSDADKGERLFNGFIVDDNGLIDNLEHIYRTQLIG